VSNVAIISTCHLGDVAPIIPSGRRLVDGCHAVTFVAPAGFAGALVAEPFTHRHSGLDFSAAAMRTCEHGHP